MRANKVLMRFFGDVAGGGRGTQTKDNGGGSSHNGEERELYACLFPLEDGQMRRQVDMKAAFKTYQITRQRYILQAKAACIKSFDFLERKRNWEEPLLGKPQVGSDSKLQKSITPFLR